MQERKKIFITGGTTGLGLELAKLYHHRGYLIGICGRDLSKLQTSWTPFPSDVKTYQVDVRNREKLKDIVQDFAGPEGQLDIMIANAGIGMPNKTPLPNFDRVRDVLDINIFGVVNSFEAAIPYMIKNKNGQLVAMASVAGMIGVPGTAAYCASKAAVLKLCESFSIDLPQFGIHVTAIAPGFVDTPLTQKNRHKMPFLMPAQKAAKIIASAIDKKRALLTFPLSMSLVMGFLYHLPRWAYRILIKKVYKPH